jgi:anaphase-promoting complex subunit 6
LPQTKILEDDPYHLRCLRTHIAVLVELKLANALFMVAHRLVDDYPDEALSWFAVGCYYLLTNQHDSARRYFRCAAHFIQ